MKKAALLFTSLIAAGSLAAGASANKPADAQCWSTPNQIAVGDSYSVTASGLPTNSPLNLVVFYPDGSRLTTPATSTDGAYSLQSSGSSIQAAQAGSYSFKFVGKVSWPSGTWNKEYASCSMQVG
ncbi:MAG: hypothetical protein ABI927_03420 [Gaiellaceae bacterium]